MSNEEQKVKRSKRMLKDENAVNKQTKIAKSHGIDVREPHKFAKHHAWIVVILNVPCVVILGITNTTRIT